MKLMTIKCVVAGYNANGEPDFYFCKVRCTEQQMDNGDHYDRARRAASENGYEGSAVSIDEFDSAGRAIDHLFVWESASILAIA